MIGMETLQTLGLQTSSSLAYKKRILQQKGKVLQLHLVGNSFGEPLVLQLAIVSKGNWDP